ncbi:hypothetical protein Ahy_B08g094407 [Arachis hypogaea]|uniref:MULE transposase domain-containing protein n=1 Tax=Arachis hypogaea TaxID=3818 RepID=A0A444Y8T7_ARAHY|nr:hypothetical protein Ahy_B08g094407 [Arachis hypogaea]
MTEQTIRKLFGRFCGADHGCHHGMRTTHIMMKVGCMGVGVRKGDSQKDDIRNLIRRRQEEGTQQENRTNWEAKFSIYLDKSASLWHVRKLDNNHNHNLTYWIVHLIPRYCPMTDAAKAQLNGLNECGILTVKSLRHMTRMAGEYSLIGFLKKDAYNYIDKRRRRRIADADVEAAIAYLEGLVEAVPMVMVRYNLTYEDIRVDFQYFGDVLVFDSTYKKNKYRRSLVIFSISNNHKQTTIFGFGLVLDEIVAS